MRVTRYVCNCYDIPDTIYLPVRVIIHDLFRFISSLVWAKFVRVCVCVYSFLVPVCLINLSWKMKKVRADTGLVDRTNEYGVLRFSLF